MSSAERADEDTRFVGGLWRELSELSVWRCLFLILCQEGFAWWFVVAGVCRSGMCPFAAGLQKCSLSFLASSSLWHTNGAAFRTSLTNFCLPTRDKKPLKLFYKCDSVRTNTMWMCCKMDLQKRSADVLDSSIFFCFGTCEPFVSHWFTTLNETNICLCGNSSTSAAFGLRFKNCAQKTYVYFNHSQNIHLLCPTFCFTSRVIERVQCFLWINEPQQVPYGCLQPCAKLEV